VNKNHCLRLTLIALGAALLAGIAHTAAAATLCVNPGGSKGCFATIGAAVAAASSNDTINVSAGAYKEDVVIGKPLSLIGANQNNTIIDAAGLANGVYIDGRDNPGLSNVVVTGFTAQNANFEGILVTNASFVTVWGNTVTDNDRNLEPSIPACPGIPDFETGEALDCGEGIHLLGVDHSTVASNTVENNSGGILLSDDTGQTRDNLVTRRAPAQQLHTWASFATRLPTTSRPIRVSGSRGGCRSRPFCRRQRNRTRLQQRGYPQQTHQQWSPGCGLPQPRWPGDGLASRQSQRRYYCR